MVAHKPRLVRRLTPSWGRKADGLLAGFRTQHEIPPEVDLAHLASKLAGKAIITSIMVCPAYALHLVGEGARLFLQYPTCTHSRQTSLTDSSEISFCLSVEAPVALAPVVTGPSVKTKWRNKYGSGLYREGNGEQDVFTILYDLRCYKKKSWFRDSPVPGDDGSDG